MKAAGALVAAGLLVGLVGPMPGADAVRAPARPQYTPPWTRLAHAMRTRYRPGGPCVELQHALWMSDWDARLIPVLVAIARAESNCRTEATRRTPMEFSVGPLQLNLLAHRGVSVRCAREYGCAARVALAIYRQQGLAAWSAYRNGSYRTRWR